MRVSTRVEYGLIALTDIVLHSENGESVSAPDISKRQHISHKYLEQILLHLRQAGFIRAQKGLRGGYVLSRSPGTIRLSEILNALDNSILEEMDAAGEEDGRSLRGAVNECLWKKLNRSLIEFAENKTLQDFMQECRERVSGGWDLYII